MAWSLWTALPHLEAKAVISWQDEEENEQKRRGTAKFWFLVLTLSLQHLQGGFGSGSGLPLGFGQQLALLLQPLLALLLLLLLLLPALQLQALLGVIGSVLRPEAENVGGWQQSGSHLLLALPLQLLQPPLPLLLLPLGSLFFLKTPQVLIRQGRNT